ncbi:uncharacterized protein BP5553_00754 [Venustampulla echinocandica]|uniref:SET domain-containing protein n=1 Tax=Venustampulla echinocandica TaxID=2656787 RepID=A0A370TZ38_9HELO|nr:uncharacterized protein BP5553_00754 [Venustampulla echinocandica]RDL40775.1 hypothetical protein BP5553_00754 [Venustampulla echinocandica]
MLFNYLFVIEVLGVTAVLAGGSEIEFGGRSDLRLKYSVDGPGHYNGSNHICQLHAQAGQIALLSLNHQRHDQHNYVPLADSLHTCPKVSTEPIKWPAGAENSSTHIPLCTRLPESYDTPTRTSWGAESLLAEQGEPYCLFTSTSFYDGRGISVLTKPSIARQIMSMPVFNLGAAPKLFQSAPPPFEIKYVQGKGMGVIANRTIFRGERLFARPIVGIFHNDAFLDMEMEEYELRTTLIERGVDQLPDDARERVNAMIGKAGAKNDLVGKLDVNAFAEDFGGEEHSIVVPETARMNHDCRPNTMYYFDSETLVHYTHASRTINAGEEITVTYIDPLESRADRQVRIQNSWGFECTCSHCSQTPLLTDASDGRISTINRIWDQLRINFSGEKKDGEVPEVEMIETMVSMYEQERLYAHISDVWVWAAKAYKKAGKKWEALRWAYQAEEGVLLYDGPRNPDLERMGDIIYEMSIELGLEEEDNDDDN